MRNPSRVLVVGPRWIGDVVMAQSLYSSLRKRLSDVRIDVLTPSHTAPLLARMPEVDGTVIMDIEHGRVGIAQRRKTARELRKSHYHQAIVLQRSAKAALVPWLAGIPLRTGQRGEPRPRLINDTRDLDTNRYRLKAEHYALLGLAEGSDDLPPLVYPRLTVDTANQTLLTNRLKLDLGRPIVGFAPGAAFGTAKRWPASRFAALARELDARGWACWIFGSAADRQIAEVMRAAAPEHSVDLTGNTSLTDAVDLAAMTTHFVGNDTGITHLAAAVAPSVIGLYGSTDPDYAPPLAPTSQRLWRGLDCSPCRQRECPLSHHACLQDLPAADVLTACLEPGSPEITSLHAFSHYTNPGEGN